nr:PAS domain-containing sensor histidine kinase [Bacillus sp. JCM 19034]
MFYIYPNSIWVLDLDFNFVHLNSACEQLISYNIEEFTSLSLSKIVHPKFLEMTMKLFNQSFYKKVESFESTLINRFGHSIGVNFTNIPIIVENEVIGIYSIINEITEFMQAERKETEVEQAYSENKFRSVFESSNDAIILTDYEMRIIAWNKAAELIFGYEEREVLGEPLEFMIPERFREGHRQGVERYRSTEEAKVIGKTVELFGLHREGHEFPLELTLNTWKDGTDMFFSAIIRDVTERQKAQELFLNSEKLSIAGQLAAGIAHEIRNPLTAIKGFIQLLQSQSKKINTLILSCLK